MSMKFRKTPKYGCAYYTYKVWGGYGGISIERPMIVELLIKNGIPVKEENVQLVLTAYNKMITKAFQKISVDQAVKKVKKDLEKQTK